MGPSGGPQELLRAPRTSAQGFLGGPQGAPRSPWRLLASGPPATFCTPLQHFLAPPSSSWLLLAPPGCSSCTATRLPCTCHQGSQEEPGGAGRSPEAPGGARRSQDEPGGARSQEEPEQLPGAPESELFGASRNSNHQLYEFL